MRISDYIKSIKQPYNAKIGKARVVLQEEDPYLKSQLLDGTLVTNWYPSFITKVDDSFANNKSFGMGSKERAVFDLYTKFSVFTETDLYDQATKNLDAYLATILTEDLTPTVLVAK